MNQLAAKWRGWMFCGSAGLSIGFFLFHVSVKPVASHAAKPVLAIHIPTLDDLALERMLGPSIIGVRVKWRARQ